jgi:hypothetical protein
MPSSVLDWAAVAIVLFVAGGVLGAFFLYLRNSYRKGGWKRMKSDLIIAIVALLALATSRIIESREILHFKHAADQGFREKPH